MWRSSDHLLCVSQRHGWNQKSQICTPQTKGHISTIACFLAQASRCFFFMSFSSGFFAVIRPWRPDFTESPQHQMFRDVSYFNSVKHLFGLRFEVQLTRMNLSSAAEVTLGSSFPMVVLMRTSFIIGLDVFCDCTWRNFQRSWHFPDWLTFMS